MMHKENDKFELEWNFEKAKNQIVDVKLGMLLKIDLPKNKFLDEKLDEFLMKHKEEVWDEIKTKAKI